MPFDEGTAQRVREILQHKTEFEEKKMFGGLSFMVNGYMSCGVLNDLFVARVGPDAYQSALGKPHTRPMDFTGRPMKGYVYVEAEGFADQGQLAGWIDACLAFVATLPPR